MAPQKQASISKEPSENSASVAPASAQPPNPPSIAAAANGTVGNKSLNANTQAKSAPDSASSSSSKRTPAVKPTVTSPNHPAPQAQAPASLSQSSPALAADRPLADIISETFPSFDHQRLVVGPFTEETARDAKFEQELGTMLLDVILETHAWASARPKFESQLAVQKLENKISDVIEVEKTQEQTRQSLNEFVTRMRTALAALTGL